MRRGVVTGGVRSGKSTFAESLLAAHASVDYVATSAPADGTDPEWDERVAVHVARRPSHWRTLETLDVAGVLRADGEAAVLIDCLGTWLARTMDECGAWDDEAPDAPRPRRAVTLQDEISRLLAALEETKRTVVLVTNEVGDGIVPETASGRRFRDELGRLNARVAAVCDTAWICVMGIPVRLKAPAVKLGRQ